MAWTSTDPYESVMLAGGYTASAMRAARERIEAQQVIEAEEFNRARARRVMRRQSMPEWIEALVFEIAQKRNVSALDIVQKSRRRTVVPVRHEILYLVRRARPHLSFPRIGSWFRMEHTAVLYGTAKHAAINGLPPVSNYNAMERLRRK